MILFLCSKYVAFFEIFVLSDTVFDVREDGFMQAHGLKKR